MAEAEGFGVLVRQFELAAEKAPKQAAAVLNAELEFLVERAKANVDVVTGKLQRSIRVIPAQVEGGALVVGGIAAGGPDVPYALLEHERPNTGRRTDQRTPEGGRGSKYITRVVDFHRKRLQAALRRFAGQMLTGQTSSGQRTPI
jgi:hypothetical protein